MKKSDAKKCLKMVEALSLDKKTTGSLTFYTAKTIYGDYEFRLDFDRACWYFGRFLDETHFPTLKKLYYGFNNYSGKYNNWFDSVDHFQHHFVFWLQDIMVETQEA